MFKRYQPGAAPNAVDHSTPILTMGVITISILVFLAIHFQGGANEVVERWGAIPSERIWSGEVRGLISGVFVHIEPMHLIFNMLAMWQIGSAIELELGPARWLALFIGSAIVSSGLQMVEGNPGIGMSGVVYGFFGFAWASRWQIDRFRMMLSQQTAGIMLIWLVGCWIGTLMGFMRIANEAHLGGLIFGTLVGEVFVRKRLRVLLSVALVLFSIGAVLPAFWAPWTGEWAMREAQRALDRQDYDTAVPWLYKSLRAENINPEWVWANLRYIYSIQGDAAGLARVDAEEKKREKPQDEPKTGFGLPQPPPKPK